MVAALAVLSALVIWVRVPQGLRFQPVRLADLASVLGNGRLMLAIVFTALSLGAIYVPLTYLAPLLGERMGLDRDGVTAVLLVCGLGAVAGNLVGGLVADGHGPFRTLLGFACLQVALMPLLSTLPLPLGLAMAPFFVWNACGYGFIAGQQMRLVVLAAPQAPVAISLHAAYIYIGARSARPSAGLSRPRRGSARSGWRAASPRRPGWRRSSPRIASRPWTGRRRRLRCRRWPRTTRIATTR